jgi:hypothetical protein
MATKYYIFKGKASWHHLVKPDQAFGAERWSLNLVMNEEEVKRLADTGCMLQPKEVKDSDSGEKYVQFRRPVEKKIKGEMVYFDPPEVYDADGEAFEEVIGHDSELEVKVAIYDTIKGKGHRLESVKVVSHIPYTPSESSGEEEEESTPKPKKKAPW